ncbi:flagellar export protein FliJ [Desulfovibrio aminophilus]|nr:flagellar export protein FliJ [Desulfovibrio aminophilus]MCM0754729.1 flagellar export protein FliJ [Desulfovibrio aminophilus]
MPGPFVFKLEKVLDYRTQLEEQAKLDLARAIAEHARGERAAAELEARLAEHLRRGVGQGASSVNEIWLWRQYRQALEQDLIMAKAELARLALKLQRARQDAVSRSKDRKLLEKLKEQQARKHHEEQALREAKETEEMAVLRHERSAL